MERDEALKARELALERRERTVAGREKKLGNRVQAIQDREQKFEEERDKRYQNLIQNVKERDNALRVSNENIKKLCDLNDGLRAELAQARGAKRKLGYVKFEDREGGAKRIKSEPEE